MNVPLYLVNILKNVFLNTRVCVNYSGEYSDKWKIKSGVRQGGILSAYLFNIYIDEMFDRICLLIKESHLQINVNKTVTMIFNPSSKRTFKELVFNIDKNVLNNVNSYKYLGSIISSNLSETLDMGRCNTAFNRSFGFLFRKFSSVDTDILFSLFNSFCSSFYGAELWIDRRKASVAFKHLSVSYHAALKKILGFPRYFSNHYTCSILNTIIFEHFYKFHDFTLHVLAEEVY